MHTRELFDLSGRVALVTGGAGKYGRCIVEALAEAGATVITASRNEEACRAFAATLHERGLAVHGRRLDQADEKSVAALRDSLAAEFGGTDILVNNAVARPGGAGLSFADAWRESMRINAVGLAICTDAFFSEMRQRGSGCIINIASMYGLLAQCPHLYEGTGGRLGVSRTGDYAFHRAGIINYTRYLAAAGAPGVRANCISPGGLDTGDQSHDEQFLRNYARRAPLGRMAGHDDIKGAVVFLAGPAAAYVTGHNLVVDGGWTIW